MPEETPVKEGPFDRCVACPTKVECMDLRECVGRVHEEAHAAHEAYIAAGVCSGCGAKSGAEARQLCRPQQDQSGEWSCAGDELWPDDADATQPEEVEADGQETNA